MVKTLKPLLEKYSIIFTKAVVFPAQGPPVSTIFLKSFISNGSALAVGSVVCSCYISVYYLAKVANYCLNSKTKKHEITNKHKFVISCYEIHVINTF